MSPSADLPPGAALGPLVAAFERLTPAARRDPRAAPALEGVIEALYAAALGEPWGARADLAALLAREAESHPSIAAWLGVVRLRLARRGARDEALQQLDVALDAAGPRSRWLAGAEAARLLWKREGAATAWTRALTLEPFLEENGEEGAWLRESPMVASAVLTWLGLAAVAGDFVRHERLARVASTYWPEASLPSVRVGLLLADHAVLRGRYRDALDRLDQLQAVAQGDLLVHLLCTRLHALIALGRGSRPQARRTYTALRRASRAPRGPDPLPDGELRALRRRSDRIARQSGLVPAAPGRGGSLVIRLLALEQKARGMRRDLEAKVRLLFSIVDRADAALCRPGPVTDVEAWLRLRLLRCRVLVDLAAHEVFADCVEELSQIHEEATARGLAPLAMLALDQRAVVRARSPHADWPGVVGDSSHAAALAVELLAANAGPVGSRRAVERALLADLLPIFDRVLELHAEGALRVASRHPTLLSEPIQRYTEARDAETEEGTWVRFGRVLHAYAEQIQALALQEARRAYADGRTWPTRVAITADGPPRVVVDDLCAALPERDGLLQYFVFGERVIVFVFGRDVFDWHVAAAPTAARGALKQLVDGLRAFTRGEDLPEERESIAALQSALLPPKIQASIAAMKLRHLRIVPHDALYRVPFGKLTLGSTPLVQRVSLSIHATGRLAVAALPREPERRRSIGHVLGPGVACVAEDARAIRGGVGSFVPLAGVSTIDTATQGLAALRERAGDHDVLHFTCHGTEGGGLSPPTLRLCGPEAPGDPTADALDLAGAAGLRVRRGALIVLQSCWTGWMDHARENPVQGFPQAFCDAGAAAVIAPLVPLPEALAPFFSNVLYRALRFLPAEQALHRALAVLRAHGQTLVAGHPEALAKLREHGSIDAFEYRYAGSPGLRFGGILARLVGRISFWWWHRRLTRGGAGGAGRL